MRIVIFLLLGSMVLLVGCSSPAEPENREEDRAIIHDSNDRAWDVTYARDVYNMNPEYYNYGLGIGAIASVDDPVILEEGDAGYPEPDANTRVFGVDHNGEQRAYGVSDLSVHEVFNDTYPGESDRYLAITY